MSLLAIATEFKRLTKTKTNKVSDNYDIQLNVELFRDVSSNIFHNEILKIHLGNILDDSVDSEDFVKYIKTKIIELEYSFLPYGIDRKDKICICKATLNNNYKIIGTFVCRNGKYAKRSIENRAYNDTLNKLKYLERYHIMAKLADVDIEIKALRKTKRVIENNLISLIKNNKVIIPLVF